VKDKKTAAIQAASQIVATHGATVEAIVDDTVETVADDNVDTVMTDVDETVGNNTTATADTEGGVTDCDGCANAAGEELPPYTFMGYNARSRERLPDGLGNAFPAFFTHKGAVDMMIIDLMRPLLTVGVRPKQLADVLLELASKKYHRE